MILHTTYLARTRFGPIDNIFAQDNRYRGDKRRIP